jgi:hypothetical protein
MRSKARHHAIPQYENDSGNPEDDLILFHGLKFLGLFVCLVNTKVFLFHERDNV